MTGPFEIKRFAIGIRSQDLFHGHVMFFVFGRRARNAEFIQNIFDEAELLKMNFMAVFSLDIFDVNSQEVFNVALVFEKKFIRQSGNEVINNFVILAKTQQSSVQRQMIASFLMNKHGSVLLGTKPLAWRPCDRWRNQLREACLQP